MSPPPTPARTQFVISLAGHIDHGKSCLVHALTGGVVDRLPEEKRRGITIDLGFAHFDDAGQRFALIDVPGHERFIHTMVAGASGVDAALLVVAADDSVMPQTREHLVILQLLGVRRGVVAVTKCDLADDEQLSLVDLEIDELVATTFLASAPRVRVSAQAGLGITELRTSLVEVTRQSAVRSATDSRFRMPIDRAFSPKGQGAVVTGTVWRGVARVGETLHLLPQQTPVRVRRLQSQGRDVEQIAAGERGAINLVGIKAAEIRRGDELATPKTFEPACRHMVQLRLLEDAPRTLRHRQFVRAHLGSNQVTAQVLLDQRGLAPGETAAVILRCRTPIVTEYGQPLVLRQLSPAATIGGGTILAPALRPEHRLRQCLAFAEGLSATDARVRLTAHFDLRREASLDDTIESWTGLSSEQCSAVVQGMIERREVFRTPAAPLQYVTAARFGKLKQQMLRRCQIELERRRPAAQVPVSAVLAAMNRLASSPVLESVLSDMVAHRELVRRGDRIGLPGGAELSHRQRQTLDGFLAACADCGPAPPTVKEYSQLKGYPLQDLETLVQVAVDEGRLVRLTPAMVIDPGAIETLRQRLSDHFQTHPTAKVGELREQWGITRKHAVPIFEYFDQCQITQRAGDLRTAGPHIALPLAKVST